MKKMNLFLAASFLSLGSVAQENNALVLVGPDVLVEYQIVNMSANGRWACGNVNDGDGRGFIWDLVNDVITQVAPIGQSAPVLDIANDGTMVGLFTTNEATANGASMEVGGYFKDGQWHYLPGCGIANGISDNGQYIAGIATVNGYQAATWSLDGTMTTWSEGHVGSGYDVNNDGTMVCGFAYHPNKNNRTPAMWMLDEDGTRDSILLDFTNIGPFAVAWNFSPDGTKISADKVIYDIPTKTAKRIDLTGVYDAYTGEKKAFLYGYEFFRVTNNGNVVGHYTTGMGDYQHAAYVVDGKIYDLQEYLKAKHNVTLDDWVLLECTGISEDETMFAVNAFDKANIPHPIVINLNANMTNPSPTLLKAVHLEDTDVCRLTWKAPLANVEGVKAYNLWRNGEKVAELGATDFVYYDRSLANGHYEYAVTAVYADSESEKCASALVEVADFAARAPRLLNAVQTGVRDVRLFWNAPLVSRPALKYGSAGDYVASFGGGEYNFEQAVRIEAADLAVYGKQITDVYFYPMSKQNSWTVNFYTAKDTTLFASQKLDDSNLVYGMENTVRLAEPVTVPAGEDIYVGISVDVTGYGGYSVLGAIFNSCRAGYTDLLRREGEPAFMSLYENAMSDPDGAYEYPITFPIGVCLGEASQSVNEVVSYKVYVDNTEVGTTEDCKYRQADVADGNHQFSVAAVYSNGTVTEPVCATLDVAANMAAYKKISNVALANLDGKSVRATWEAPCDDDETLIGYSSDVNAGGLAPSKDNGYSALYAASYDKDNFQLYGGYQITHVRFFPTADAEFAISLRVDGKEVVWKELERGVDYTKGLWNTIKLDEPVTVTPSSEYLLVLDCYDVTPGEAPIGMDNLPPFERESDLFSEDNGKTFTSVSAMDNATRQGNWMIGLVIRSTDSKPLPVKGYDVYVDRKKVTETSISETTFTHEVGEGTHQVRIDVLYDGMEKPVQGTTHFIDMVDGINDVEFHTIVVDVTATAITVVGGQVTGVALYSADGSLVAQAEGETLPVSHLQSGVYVLKAVVDGVPVTRKLVIG